MVAILNIFLSISRQYDPEPGVPLPVLAKNIPSSHEPLYFVLHLLCPERSLSDISLTLADTFPPFF